jgi:glyoxylase-like metal-dependent hydrolase (beta-lactamase superfamily II)
MEILPGVHWVESVNANPYLLTRVDGKLVVVDTGMPGNAKKILEYLSTKMNRDSKDLKTILLTHCHPDHAGSALELKELTGAKIAIHRDDADYVAGRKKLPPIRGPVPTETARFPPPPLIQPDLLLEDGEIIDGLKVIHIPGHTPGSIALFDQSRRILFTGDALLAFGGKVNGPSEQFSVDIHEARRSIKRLTILDFDIMLSGHGDPLRANAAALVREFYDSLKKSY